MKCDLAHKIELPCCLFGGVSERLIFSSALFFPCGNMLPFRPWNELYLLFEGKDVIVHLRQAAVGFEHTQSDHCNVSDLLFPLTDEVLAQRKMRYFQRSLWQAYKWTNQTAWFHLDGSVFWHCEQEIIKLHGVCENSALKISWENLFFLFFFVPLHVSVGWTIALGIPYNSSMCFMSLYCQLRGCCYHQSLCPWLDLRHPPWVLFIKTCAWMST